MRTPEAVEGQTSRPPSRRALAALIGSLFVLSSAIVVLVVLPAEFHVDPTGFGRITGLYSLSAPPEVKVAAPSGPGSIAHRYDVPFRSDMIEITLPPEPEPGSELEYKVRMREGATLVYSWEVPGVDPDEFYTDFHSQSDPSPEVKVISHLEGSAAAANGSLVAPFTGIHGWFAQNSSVTPVVMRLRLAGFYELQDIDVESIPVPSNVKVLPQPALSAVSPATAEPPAQPSR